MALLFMMSLQLAMSVLKDHPPPPPPDTTPPKLRISFIGHDDEILSQSPTEIRVKPGSELINTTLATDDGGALGMVWYFTFQGRRYGTVKPIGGGPTSSSDTNDDIPPASRLIVPTKPGTYMVHGYARDAAGNETTREYRIIVVDEDGSEREQPEEPPGFSG